MVRYQYSDTNCPIQVVKYQKSDTCCSRTSILKSGWSSSTTKFCTQLQHHFQTRTKKLSSSAKESPSHDRTAKDLGTVVLNFVKWLWWFSVELWTLRCWTTFCVFSALPSVVPNIQRQLNIVSIVAVNLKLFCSLKIYLSVFNWIFFFSLFKLIFQFRSMVAYYCLCYLLLQAIVLCSWCQAFWNISNC